MSKENKQNDNDPDLPPESPDKAERIRENIKSTLHNMETAEELIGQTADEKEKRELEAKNARRAMALPSLVKEMKEEEARKELGISEE